MCGGHCSRGLGHLLLEPRLRITNRTRTIAGTAAIVLALGGVLGGLVATGGGLNTSLSSIQSQWRGLIDDLRGLAPDDDPSTTGGESANPSRFLIPGSSGRWDLWRVAWLDFKSAPAGGIGAGNYVFTYNRDRIRDRYGRDAHSLPLGALAETGLVGGLLLFGSLGLAMGAVLTPRAAAAWRMTRQLLRPGPTRSVDVAATSSGDRNLHLLERETAWTMASLTAVLLWLLHATVDWLWEMTAITIPALLFLAMALSQKDQSRSGARQRDRSGWYRWTVMGLACLILVGLSLSYVALKYTDMATANMTTDPSLARQQVRVATALAPADSQPLLVQHHLYRAAAYSATPIGARLDNLALALDAASRAADRDPANWLVLLNAAEAAERLANEVETWAGKSVEPPGKSLGSFADTAKAVSVAAHYRGLTPQELRNIARSYADLALHWNPKELGAAELRARLQTSD